MKELGFEVSDWVTSKIDSNPIGVDEFKKQLLI